MRIDKFLNTVNITKRRAIAEDMLAQGVVLINDLPVKKSKDVRVGDMITMKYLEHDEKFLVITIPTTKSTPKSAMELYVKKIGGVNV